MSVKTHLNVELKFWNKYITVDLGGKYYTEKEGVQSCKNGNKISKTSECKTACEKLGKDVGTLRPTNACYVAKNGKCRQDGRQGTKTSLVCIERGNIKIYQYSM